MSSGFTSSYGFVLKYDEASKFFEIPPIKSLEINKEKDTSTVHTRHISSGKRIEVEFFYRNSNDGDCYDTLEDAWYFIFNEDLLYEKKKTTLAKLLTKEKTFPNFEVWLNIG